ncbi:hypothetical protein [Bordetella petrii]|uniref:hypothetical protein n=1 Tax=Bordetella petrii TaxID=94624 RepID=UPI001E571B9A|nr:hypothetical protein [Bordetella petrii]MCD0502697.1 hypothetical protein [Bordetella petrii]
MNPVHDDLAEERLWRRRSLVLGVVLLLLVSALMARQSVWQWWHGRDLIVHEVPQGASHDFGGGRWRLHALRMAPLPPGRSIPENAMGVVADFRVEVLDADLATNWRGCLISLEDPQGRRWRPTQALRLPRSDAQECVAAMYSGAKAGDTLRIRQAFLVPRDAAETLQPTLTMTPQQPRYLRFAQHPERVQVQ